jgi:hypothetical protein
LTKADSEAVSHAVGAKVLGILRDALRQKSMGVIEELPDKGIVKYAKPPASSPR